MNRAIHSLARVLGMAALAAACAVPARADGENDTPSRDLDRDPALLLQRSKRSRETPRRYESSLEVKFDMMRVGKTRKREARIEALDIPEARDGISLRDLTATPNLEIYAPPPTTDVEDEPKKNWILPPKPDLEEETEEFSDDPMDMILRMYEEEAAARRSLIDGVLSGESSLAELTSQMQDPGETGDRDDSGDSAYGEDTDEFDDPFLFGEEEDSVATALGGGTEYEPVISATALRDSGDTVLTLTPATQMDPEDLENLSNEELMALAERQAMPGEGEEELELSDTDSLSGIQQFTRESGVERLSGLRQTQAILSGITTTANAEPEDDPGAAVGAAAVADSSWRSSLSTLSGVLARTAPGAASPDRTTTISGGTRAMDPVAGDPPGMSGMRDAFSFGGTRDVAGSFRPAASSGLGGLGRDLAAPVSIGGGSGLSSGISPVGSLGSGGSSSLGAGSTPAAPPKRALDVRSLDILMN